MIARLEGSLREVSPTRVVVDVGGVGYEVWIPLSTFGELPDAGKTVALHVYTHARDGAIQLFGFYTRAERVAFDLLLRASRVGPRLAQTVLSGITPEDLCDALRGNHVGTLQAVPGIGARMAERILMELRDRTDALAAVLGGAFGSPGGEAEPRKEVEGVREQALSALLNLGYPKAQAERVLSAAEASIGSGTGLEALVRSALRRLAR